MPMYDFECPSCKAIEEKMLGINDDKKNIECSKCNTKMVLVILSAPGFILKGTGWYVTDYPKEGQKKTSRKKKTK